jgi:hypothetical protein
LVRPETMRSSTSVSHAKGSTPLSFAVATRLEREVEEEEPATAEEAEEARRTSRGYPRGR